MLESNSFSWLIVGQESIHFLFSEKTWKRKGKKVWSKKQPLIYSSRYNSQQPLDNKQLTTMLLLDCLSFFTESHTKIVTLHFNGDVKDFFKCVKHSVVLFFLLWSNILFLITSLPVTTNILADVIIKSPTAEIYILDSSFDVVHKNVRSSVWMV